MMKEAKEKSEIETFADMIRNGKAETVLATLQSDPAQLNLVVQALLLVAKPCR